jgi:Ca2+-binding EF-hand superfamily protein
MVTKEEVVQKVLDRFDGDGNKKITKSEFLTALEEEGVPVETRDALYVQVWQNWDRDENDTLSKSEIDALAKKWASFS